MDYFVLVEATTTHSGQPKELVFRENRARYDAFLHKIIHIVIEDMPPILRNDRWQLENYQRRCISRALTNCERDDIILISDVDEIPDCKLLQSFVGLVSKESLYNDFRESVYHAIYCSSKELGIQAIGKLPIAILTRLMKLFTPWARIYSFRHRHYEYYLNGYVNNDWPGMVVARLSTVRRVFDMDTQAIRDIRCNSSIKSVQGGWHFTYLGGPERIAQKIHAFAHAEFDAAMFTDPNRIQRCIEKGENLFGKEGGQHRIEYIPIVEATHPKYVVENWERLSQYIKEV